MGAAKEDHCFYAIVCLFISFQVWQASETGFAIICFDDWADYIDVRFLLT